MSTSRKIEEIASNLDDMSVTLEEIKEAVRQDDEADTGKLDEIQHSIDRAAEAIDEVVDPEQPPES